MHSVRAMCRLLGRSASGFYAWLDRGPSDRAKRDAELTVTIHKVHAEARGTYGVPRVHAELGAQGLHIGSGCAGPAATRGAHGKTCARPGPIGGGIVARIVNGLTVM